jgi:hypothetical protein
LNALEQYLSRVSGSTETLHQGLAKAYLPFVLRKASTPVTHQENFEAPTHIPLPSNSVGEAEAQRLASSAHLAAFPGFENYPPSKKRVGHNPTLDTGEDQHSGGRRSHLPLPLPFPFFFQGDIPGANNLPDTNAGTAPSLAPPLHIFAPNPAPLSNRPTTASASKQRVPDVDNVSVSPSHSLSRIASQRQKTVTPKHGDNPKPNDVRPPAAAAGTKHHVNEHGEQGTSFQKKEMALLDWARGVSGPLHHHHDHQQQRTTTSHPPQSQQQRPTAENAESVVMSPGSRMGGTNVDDAGGRSSASSSTTTEDDQQYFTGEPTAAAQCGTGQSFVGVASQQHQQTDYNPNYLHPESYPFPQQQQQQPGLTPSASASQYGWQSPAITERLPRDDEVSLMERLTVGGTTLGGLTTAGGVPL